MPTKKAAAASKPAKTAVKKAAAPAAATTPAETVKGRPDLKVGDTMEFAGYAQEVDEAILVKGELVKIEEVIDAENFHVSAVADPARKDSAFDTEMKDAPADAVAPTTEAAPTKVVKLKAGKAPAATAAPAAKAAKPAAATKPTVEELKPLALEVYSPDVQKIIKSDAAALKAAKSLTETIKETFWTLGAVLSFIRRNKSYVGIEVDGATPYAGKAGFDDYCETELQLSYRKAMYYIDIFETFAPLGIEADRVLALGWSKAKELTGVVTKKNVNKWLDKAEKMVREDLAAEVKQTRVQAGESGAGETNPSDTTVTMSRFKFAVFADQGNVVNEALNRAKELIGDTDLNKAFAHIATDWLNMQGGAPGATIEDAMATLENTFSLAEVKKYVLGHYKK